MPYSEQHLIWLPEFMQEKKQNAQNHISIHGMNMAWTYVRVPHLQCENRRSE